LFAGEDIEKDKIIYIFKPEVDLVMKAEQINSIGQEFTRFMRIYAFAEITTKEIMISLDNSRFMNHCEFPNTLWTYTYGWAARYIREGEELTCDYYSFWHEPPI
jgi:SET domain-containing protein